MRFSNMSIKLFSVIFVVSLFSTLYASETRVATMGSKGLYVKDNSNVMMFPGLLLSYSELVISELRPNFGFNRQQDYSVGLHMDYGDMASALYINQPINSTILNVGLQAFDEIPGAPTLSSELNNAYVFMFALKLAGFDAGFGLVTAGTSVDNGTVEEKATYLAILAGLSNKKLDVGLRAELPSIEVSNGGSTKFSGFALGAQGRYQLMTVKGANIFPVGQFSFGSASYKDGFEVDFSGMMFSVGIGMEKPINEDNLLIVGLDGFAYETLEIDSKTTDVTETTTTITFPAIYMGLESRISSWLIGRIGVRHTNVSVTEELTGADDVTDDGSTFHLALGLGMEFGNFLIDFGMNEGLLFDGPYIFSHTNGASSPNGSITQFASKISITYNFGGEDEKE